MVVLWRKALCISHTILILSHNSNLSVVFPHYTLRKKACRLLCSQRYDIYLANTVYKKKGYFQAHKLIFRIRLFHISEKPSVLMVSNVVRATFGLLNVSHVTPLTARLSDILSSLSLVHCVVLDFSVCLLDTLLQIRWVAAWAACVRVVTLPGLACAFTSHAL